jgi:hypothetical protein
MDLDLMILQIVSLRMWIRNLIFCKMHVAQLPFSERWKLIEEEIVRPRNYERKQFEVEGRSNPVYKYDMELFGVRFLSSACKFVISYASLYSC